MKRKFILLDFLLFLFVVVVWTPVEAQFCTGTLGDNIFKEGDFGTGNTNLLSPNPGIAPGYNYTFNVPPVDGQYVITNRTSTWSLWPSWLAIGDNSSDPNGYMMVVNASNDPGLFYQQTVSGLCENTLYEFTADIINLIKIGTPNHIDPDVSFLLDGVVLFNTGNIAKTEQWTTYGFTFTTAPGQQSLTLSLQNNAPGGNGNDLAIDNISFRACGPETMVSPEASVTYLCEDSSPIEFTASIFGNQYVTPAFQWQVSLNEGDTWEDIPGATDISYVHPMLSAGIYYYRFVVADGVGNLSSDNCRVNSNAKIINVLPGETTIIDTICNGGEYVVGQSIYNETGNYIDTLTNILGCDSVVLTNLTVEFNPDFMAELTVLPPCGELKGGSISVENISGGLVPYTFAIETGDFGDMATFLDLEGGVSYDVMVKDANDCLIKLSAFIEEGLDLYLDLGDDLSVELGESVTIIPSFNFTPLDFNWEVQFEIECDVFDDCDQLVFLPTASQQLKLSLSTRPDCFISDSLFITVEDVRKVWMPNVFSPNGDDVNDFFTVLGSQPNVEMVVDLTIVDRWGSVMFLGQNFLPNDQASGWNGRTNGKEVSPGLYVYSANIRFIDGQVLNYSGDVLLIR